MKDDFAPYTAKPLACAEVPGVSCIQHWRDLLFVGRSDGSLTVLKSSVDVGNPMRTLVWKTLSVKRLGQQILQLAVSMDRSLLFCLTDEGVSLYSLPQLLMKGQAGRTRGSLCFSWNDATNQLAVGVKKKVVIYEYDGLEFVYRREIPSFEPPLYLHTLNGTVFICHKKEIIAALPNGTVAKLKQLQDNKPCGFAAGPREVVFTVSNTSYFADETGKVLSREPVTWRDSPSAVAVSGSHLLALVPKGLEVQLFHPKSDLKLSQFIPMEEASILNARVPEGGVYAASLATGKIQCVLPLSATKQAEQLLRCEAFEDCLTTCRQIPEGQEPARADLEARTRLAYGRQLLSEQRYEEGMLNLGMSPLCDPFEVLLSFPFLIPEGLAQKAALGTSDLAQMPPVEEIPKVVSILTPYLLSYRSRLASGAVNSLEAASDAVGPTGRGVPLKVLIDTALLKAFLVLPDNGALLQFVQRPNDVDIETGAMALHEAGRYAELIALYKSHGDYARALDILEKLTRSPDELKVKPRGAAIELTGLPGVWAAIQLVSSHEPRDFSLISTHSKWILRRDAEAGIEMFVRLYPDVDPSVVLPILSSFGPDLAASYLQKVVEAGAEERTFHHDLAMLLLAELKENGAKSNQEKLRNLILTSDYLDYEALLRLLPPRGLWSIRAALFERVERHIDALRIYVHFLHDPTAAEDYCNRVISKQRPNMGVYSDYTVPQATLLSEQESVYALLVQVMLEEEDKSHPGTFKRSLRAPEDARWKEIAQLLSRKRDVVHPMLALSLLPEQIPLSSCADFLDGALRGMSEKRRKISVLASLYRGRHLTALFQATDAQQKSVTITQDRACWMCNKRLGVAAMVHLPGGALAHYSCYRRSQLAAVKTADIK